MVCQLPSDGTFVIMPAAPPPPAPQTIPPLLNQDTNVARVCARLGWIPLQSEAALEDLDQYPDEPEVHKYLHKRLMAFDLSTLYELHYLMITLGKVGTTAGPFPHVKHGIKGRLPHRSHAHP